MVLFSQLILSIAKSVGVPGTLLLAICTHESNLTNVKVLHDNGSPSYGLCQIKFDTAKGLGFKGKADDLMIPKINIRYSAMYLRSQLIRYNWNWLKATAAYNSGTYNPSKNPNIPRNIKYINKIKQHLPDDFKHFLEPADECSESGL